MRVILVATTLSLIFSQVYSNSAFAGKDSRKWDDQNNPGKMGNYQYNFKALPLEGSIANTKRGWSDTYWPLEEGMIAVRWQVPGSNFKKDKSPTRDELTRLTETEIALLSPAEKLDLAKNDYDYTITKSIRDDLSGNEREWRGLCNGWTHASLNYDEPQPVVFTNARGLKIPFGSSDIKAMLAYYHAKVDNSSAVLVGARCRLKPAMSWASKSCKDDINAGAFHLIMANELGIKKQGFAADRDPYNEVWNQPYVKYESKIVQEVDKLRGGQLSRDASKDAVKEITISTDAYFADDEEIVQSNEAYISTGKNKITKTTYNYILELDVAGRVIGGEWLDQNRPDFIWKQTFNAPNGNFKVIQTIYELSQKERT